jgi:hypothetical protein
MLRKITTTFLLMFVSTSSFASTVMCEGWYQEQGKALEKASMALQSSTANNSVFTVSYRGYDYRVDWDRNLTTFYVTIEQAGARILFTTARIPTDNHPENFTDLNLPGGPRLSVNCEVK